MTNEELEQAYLSLVDDSQLDQLELSLNEPNIFSILSIERMEIRHSNFLAWLCDPQENHGLESHFLKRFLRTAFLDQKAKGLSPVDAERLDYRDVIIKREWRHIDLLIQFPNLVVCLENKIGTQDHHQQLARYKTIVEQEWGSNSSIKPLYIYLTPYGDSSLEEQEEYVFFSYQQIIDILTNLLTVYHHQIPQKSAFYIQDYENALRRNLMNSGTPKLLAQQIYKNHKKLFDFILANKPDLIDEFAEVCKEFVEAKGYITTSDQRGFVRFLPPSLLEIIPQYGHSNGWADRQAILFELVFRKNNELEAKVTASPTPRGDSPNTHAFIHQIFESLKGSGFENLIRPSNWIRLYKNIYGINRDELVIKGREHIWSELERIWPQAKVAFDQAERLLLSHQAELLKLKPDVVEKGTQEN